MLGQFPAKRLNPNIKSRGFIPRMRRDHRINQMKNQKSFRSLSINQQQSQNKNTESESTSKLSQETLENIIKSTTKGQHPTLVRNKSRNSYMSYQQHK